MIALQKSIPESLHHTCVIATWPAMQNGDDGQPIELANFADRSVQVFGTFGSGGNARIEGSLDGINAYIVISGSEDAPEYLKKYVI